MVWKNTTQLFYIDKHFFQFKFNFPEQSWARLFLKDDFKSKFYQGILGISTCVHAK